MHVHRMFRQIAAADVILLNKVDLVQDNKKQDTIGAIRYVDRPIYSLVPDLLTMIT